jgi:hypothetical protein
MTNQHPIIPPRELLDKWNNLPLSTQEIFVIVAQWGADQELDACCLLLENGEYAASYGCHDGTSLRNARRPSLKELALGILDVAHHDVLEDDQIATIRRALEALPE